jgi:hypothetical protein
MFGREYDHSGRRMAELEIAGTAALGGCIGDEDKSHKTFKKGRRRGISGWEAEGILSGTSRV